jgi:very-short-patch-repair endonuclease
LTDAEQALWKKLRRKQIRDLQFYRQKPLLNFIVDFYCSKAQMVIELDGGQHFEAENLKKDADRDKALQELGLLVLRFYNRQVLMEMDSVLMVIDKVVEERLKNPPLTPRHSHKKN